ncbi:MAG: [FeFe] hydrogenase H-cluster radical SAM maturase HydG [Deltaproteobacteria bacterium]
MEIDKDLIASVLLEAEKDADKRAAAILKGPSLNGLDIYEAATLLSIKDPLIIELMLKKADEVKQRVFGSRVVLFAPLYLSNYCSNGCLYCGFRRGNRASERRALSIEEVVEEAGRLCNMGFKRVLLVTGEDKQWGLSHIISCVKAIYGQTGMRIVHVNAPPMDLESFRALKGSGVGVYQCFQETYHRPTYEVMHPTGAKKDFSMRLNAMDVAMEAGFEDVGIGPLFGLYDFRFECVSTIAHSIHLFKKFGAHAHTLSIPRLRPVPETPLKEIPYPLTDMDLKIAVSVFRLSVPSAGVVASTRESAQLRHELLHAGATQISAASRTDPGGYSAVSGKSLEQFSTSDTRPLDEVMESIAKEGYLPSLCTTCYRVGRTGAQFMERALSGGMESLCEANAILTLKEYMEDNRANGARATLEGALKNAIDGIKDEPLKKAVLEKIMEIEQGSRDRHF